MILFMGVGKLWLNVNLELLTNFYSLSWISERRFYLICMEAQGTLGIQQIWKLASKQNTYINKDYKRKTRKT